MVASFVTATTQTVLPNCKSIPFFNFLQMPLIVSVSVLTPPQTFPPKPRCHQRREISPYGLRRSIRCPKKYGDGIKERPDMPAVTCDLDTSQLIFPRPAPERFTRNAAVLPDLEPSPGSPGRAQEESSPVTSGGGPPPPEPMVIHGYTVAEYQCAYHSVVDPLLSAPCGETAAYSLELGRAIKERLFQELAYPTLAVLEQPGGRVAVVERFCVMRSAPRIAVDLRGEPPCRSS